MCPSFKDHSLKSAYTIKQNSEDVISFLNEIEKPTRYALYQNSSKNYQTLFILDKDGVDRSIPELEFFGEKRTARALAREGVIRCPLANCHITACSKTHENSYDYFRHKMIQENAITQPII